MADLATYPWPSALLALAEHVYVDQERTARENRRQDVSAPAIQPPQPAPAHERRRRRAGDDAYSDHRHRLHRRRRPRHAPPLEDARLVDKNRQRVEHLGLVAVLIEHAGRLVAHNVPI